MKKLTTNLLKYLDMTVNLDNKKKIVLIETAAINGLDNRTHNANIYCTDESNNIIWQVDSDKGIMENDSFVYIEKVENGIAARRFFGTEYIIDPMTGKSEIVGWSKC